MAGEGNRVEVDEQALLGYSTGADRLAGDVRSVGSTTLNGVNALPEDVFGKLGAEVGLSGAFRTAAQAQLDGVTAVANGIAALSHSVSKGLTGYQQEDVEAAAQINQAGQS
ncbi:MAG TPA: hypothetical protein VFV67_24820 [Actinophytocola sp.]|uniref:hypothetical protein n=1 Tax=Actinophytocola sp. TaxID=1872138 RepID=UPI002DBE008C|nr:hypothetical protein [Actinophytocola sp.]HEU5473882.1 hypothetical protein [Actinophytocola sp.]